MKDDQLYISISSTHSQIKRIGDDILFSNLNNISVPFSIDAHTRKQTQDANTWNKNIEKIKKYIADLDYSESAFFNLKMNLKFANEGLPNSTKITIVSDYDAIDFIEKTHSLDFSFSEQKFDNHINTHLEEPFILNTENHQQQLMDYFDLQDPQPLGVYKELFLHSCTPEVAWQSLKQKYQQYTNDEKNTRFIEQGVYAFDISKISIEYYVKFCKQINIPSDIENMIRIMNTYTTQKYLKELSEKVKFFVDK